MTETEIIETLFRVIPIGIVVAIFWSVILIAVKGRNH